MASAGVSSVSSEVTRIDLRPERVERVDGRKRIAPASRLCGRSDESSSNWLGVMMSAAGTAWSRMNSGMPGRTNTPRPTSPITGSQQ